MPKSLLPLFIALAFPALLPATAFDFTGQCADCVGTVTAELVLASDYVRGTTITLPEFVSFTYDGSNLLAPFIITPSEVTSISGSMPTDLPATANFQIASAAHNFDSLSDGTWVVDFHEDQGPAHIWNVASSAVPEPGAFSMLGIGLALALAVRRRLRVS